MSHPFLGVLIGELRSLLLLLALAPLAHAADFDVRPAPTWADQVPASVPSGAPLPSRSGVAGILTDHQVRVGRTDATVDEYFRRVRKVVSAAGVQNASELSIDFDPSYQRLVLHEIALVRGATRINQLEPGAVRIIEKEPESDEKIYDGQLTALVFLADVRPGDIIDYSYSLDGANPLLGGRYADEYDFSATVPTALVRHRLLWPAARPLHVRGGGAVEHRGALEVYTWERRNVQADDDEDSTPDWYDSYDSVQVSEYGSWNEVARWSAAMFTPDLESSAAVAALADRIARENPTPEARITAAIRFVQDDIRYLGIEMGRGSHEPRQPRLTLAQRYGDCKDKAFLLALLLGHFGVEAHPALVNTKLRHRLDEYLPSPFLFDHVITHVVDGGRVYWIDGTIADQGGTLGTIDTPSDERALVVRPETLALTKIDAPSRAATLVDESYAVNGDDATLDVTSTYSGGDADALRADLSTMTAPEYAKQRINLFAADHPHIERVAGPTVSDDRVRDAIVVRERYLVHRLWKDGAWTYVPRVIEEHLARPDTLIRSMPLAVDFPLNITERIRLNVGRVLNPSGALKPSGNAVDTPALHYEQRFGDGAITYSLRTKKDSVAVRDVADHIAVLNDIDDGLAFTFQTPHVAASMWAGGAASIVLVAIVAALIVAGPSRRRRNSLPITFVDLDSASTKKEIQRHAQHR